MNVFDHLYFTDNGSYRRSKINKLCGRPPQYDSAPCKSHAEYVPTLTAAAALRVKATLSKAIQPGHRHYLINSAIKQLLQVYKQNMETTSIL